MLRRVLVTVFGLLVISIVAPAVSVAAPSCGKVDPRTGVCVIFVDDPGNPGGGGGGEGGGGEGGGGEGSPILTIKGTQCLYAGLADPQPSKADPVWEGHTDGAIHMCTTAPFELSPAFRIYFWAAAPPAAAPPNPQDLARTAISTMNLHAIAIGIVPESAPGRVGVVGMPTWMWAADPGESTMGPITRSASSGGYTVTATATVNKVVWDMGDGSTVTCRGPGTPYADSYGKSSSPDCGHTYTRQGEYAVSATSYWTVQWAGIGQSGTIPLDFTNTATITMGEAQVLTH